MFSSIFIFIETVLLIPLILCADLLRALVRPAAAPLAASTTAGAPSLTLVMLNHNGKHLLEECLASVWQEFSNCGAAQEFWLIDNASTDGSRDYVKQNYPGIKVIGRNVNDGFGRSNMAVLPSVTTDAFMLLNNDIRLRPGFIHALLKAYGPGIFSVCPTVLTWDGAGVNQGRVRAWFEGAAYKIDFFATPGSVVPSLWSIGGAALFDRDKFMKLGGFDELFSPFYVEDTDICYRAWKHGWQSVYQPRATAVHRHKGTMGNYFSPEQVDVMIRRNVLLFILKNLDDRKRLAKFLGGQASLARQETRNGDHTLRKAWRAVIPKIPLLLARRFAVRRGTRYTDDEIHRLIMDS